MKIDQKVAKIKGVMIESKHTKPCSRPLIIHCMMFIADLCK